MDINRKYADHQRAVMQASAELDDVARAVHLQMASAIAGQIETFQTRLGAAASCAWGTRPTGSIARPALVASAALEL